jgi:lipopolysaccharide export system protein LptC
MSHPLRRLWDRLSIYLPLILMALMAMGSWWLVRSTPNLVPTAIESVSRHEPDYFMHNFSIKTFDAQGRLKSEISGDQARHFPDTDTVEIAQVRMRSFSEQSGISTASADQGLTNGDGSEVQLTGNALVQREARQDTTGHQVPGGEFRAEFLHVYVNTERLKTHKPVQLRRGEDLFVADGMDFDNVERVLTLRGHVRGVLQAKPAH